MDEYRVIIAGGREFDDYKLLCERCDAILVEKAKTHRIIILSGGAAGADTLGESYARERGYLVEVHPADWDRYGKRAGPIRNGVMASKAQALIAFWDGSSPGTRDIIEQAEGKGLAIRVISYPYKSKVWRRQSGGHW